MTKHNYTVARIQKLVSQLADGHELAAILENLKLPASLALRVLRGKRARSTMRRLSSLHALQRRLILQHSGPQAAIALSRYIQNNDQPSLQLRSAITLLQLVVRKAARTHARASTPRRPVILKVSPGTVRSVQDKHARLASEKARAKFAT